MVLDKPHARAKANGFLLNFRPGCYLLKVMLHETIRNNDFEHAQHNAALLEQCCNDSKQCRNNVVMLLCAKNRRCKLGTVW